MVPWLAPPLTAGCCRADKPDILRKSTDKDKGTEINTDRYTERQTQRATKANIKKESLKSKYQKFKYQKTNNSVDI